MGNKRIVSFLCFFSFFLGSLSLNTQNLQPRFVSVEIQPVIANEPLILGKKYFIPSLNDSVSLSSLRFYISDFYFSSQQTSEILTDQRHFLMDAKQPSTFHRKLPIHSKESLEQIHFKIGVDINFESIVLYYSFFLYLYIWRK